MSFSNPNHRIDIALLTDQKYVNLTAIAIDSLVTAFRNTSRPHDHELAIHVVCIDVTPAGKALMARAAQTQTGAGPSAPARVHFRCVDFSLQGDPQGKQRWVQLVSLKMHLPDILDDLDRLIFLDSDIVVVDDITPLWLTDLEGHWLGVVPCLLDDPRGLGNYNIFKIKYTHVAEPINAGVLLLDLAMMRKHNVSAQLAAWQLQHLRKLKLPEQEAISVNYARQWKILPHVWNFRPYGEPYWTAASWDELRRYLGIRPAIVHFQGNVRPFDLRVNLPYYAHWKQSHDRVNPGVALKRKTLGYFQFVFFEYPDVLCRIGSFLPSGVIRFGLMVTLLGIAVLPRGLAAYLRYRRDPDGYSLRINRYLAVSGSAEAMALASNAAHDALP